MPEEARQRTPLEQLTQLPEVKNIPQPDVMYGFDGAWMPSTDPALIGAKNFQKLINMRYSDTGIEGTTGYSKINTLPITDYTIITNGVHLRTEGRTSENYAIFRAEDSSGNGNIYINETDIGSTGEPSIDFDNETNSILVGDKRLLTGTDFGVYGATNTTSNFLAPDGTYNVARATEDSSLAQAHRMMAWPTLSDGLDYTFSVFIKAGTKNRLNIRCSEGDPWEDKVYANYDLSTGVVESLSSGGDATLLDATLVPYPNGWYLATMSFNFGSISGIVLNITMYLTETNSTWEIIYDGDGASYIDFWGAKLTQTSSYTHEPRIIHSDASANLEGRFSRGPSGTIAYANGEEALIWGGSENTISSAFHTKSAEALPIDVTDKVVNSRTGTGEEFTFDSATRAFLTIMTTRPAQAFKFYVASANGSASTLTGAYWDGTQYTAVGSSSDGTSTGGAALGRTGIFSFDDTVAVAKLHHFEERYLYSYQFELDVGSADISQITADFSMQKPTNVWDGIYRTPIQCQVYTAADTANEDFTLHVSEASSLSVPVGCIMDGFVATNDKLYLMFDEKQAGIRMTMLGNLINKVGSIATVKYWDGDTFTTVGATLDDGTAVGATQTLGQSGLISWNPPSDEERTTLFNTQGYAYEITVSVKLTGTKGSTEEVVIDLISGVPAREDIETYVFPAQYKEKLLFCNYAQGNEGNRIDYSEDNAPDIFNGENTSMDGYQSIYVGGTEHITAATQLYNRFGSNLFSSLAIFKANEIYLLTGDNPLDYKLFPVSQKIGCPAPQSLDTAEVGFEVGEDVARNVALFVSNSGPMMYDGATLQPIDGLDKYFDPNETLSVNFDYLDEARGWFDSTYREYNVLLPVGETQETLNTWLIYDLVRKKWFSKDVGTGNPIQCGFGVTADNGDQYIYAGTLVGTVMQLDSGASWAGSAIVNTVQTGDFFPSENEWDITRIRRLKFSAKRITESGAEVEFFYTADTDDDGGLSVTFRDVAGTMANSADAGLQFTDVTAAMANSGTAGVIWVSQAGTTLDLALTSGLNRLMRATQSMNATAWCHSFKFVFSSSDTLKGLQPIMWGIQWEYVRKDHEDL